MNIATATPAEIDAELYKIEAQVQDLGAKRAQREQLVAKPGRYTSEATIEWAREEIVKLTEQIVELNKLARPFNEEFSRRGGWTRAFLVVTNGQGHVHRTMDCSTCNNGIYATQFCWMTEFSGKNEQEIVDAAGERACTVCYKSAPVELRLDRPTQMFTEDEKTKAQSREEKLAKRSAAASATVVDESGKVLFKTVRGATNEISSLADSVVWYSYDGGEHPDQDRWISKIREILVALKLKGEVEDVETALKAVIDAKLAKYPAQARKANKESKLRGWANQDGYKPMPETHPGVKY